MHEGDMPWKQVLRLVLLWRTILEFDNCANLRKDIVLRGFFLPEYIHDLTKKVNAL